VAEEGGRRNPHLRKSAGFGAVKVVPHRMKGSEVDAMLPMIPKPAISRRQKAAALVVATAVDLVQMGGFGIFGPGFASPFEDALDVLTAVMLLAICGFKWQFVVAFLVELMPMADLFPTWTALVLTLPTARETAGVPARQARSPEAAEPARSGQGVVDVEAVAVPPVRGSK
jgi:hypothetical protein